MSTLVEEPPPQIPSSPAERLQATMAAVRVSLHWLGVRKTLSRQQKTEAAQSFGADGDFLSAGKKLAGHAAPGVSSGHGRTTPDRQLLERGEPPFPRTRHPAGPTNRPGEFRRAAQQLSTGTRAGCRKTRFGVSRA